MMYKRSQVSASPGELRTITWPEHHISCELCENADCSEPCQMTQAEITKSYRNDGWHTVKGKWRCPDHK